LSGAHLAELAPAKDVEAYRRSQSAKSGESRYVAVANFRGWLRRLPHEVVEEVKAGKANPYKPLGDFTSYLVSVRAAPHHKGLHERLLNESRERREEDRTLSRLPVGT